MSATGAKANVRKEESTRFIFTSVQVGGIPQRVQHLLLHIHPFLCVITVYRDTQGEETAVMKKTPHKMLHYGWARAASGQMLRHASGSKPAGRGCKNVVATQHRSCQATICRPVCCNMTAIPFLHPTPTSERWTRFCFTASAQIDPDQPSANIVLSNAPKCGRRGDPGGCWWHTLTKMEFTIYIYLCVCV